MLFMKHLSPYSDNYWWCGCKVCFCISICSLEPYCGVMEGSNHMLCLRSPGRNRSLSASWIFWSRHTDTGLSSFFKSSAWKSELARISQYILKWIVVLENRINILSSFFPWAPCLSEYTVLGIQACNEILSEAIAYWVQTTGQNLPQIPTTKNDRT